MTKIEALRLELKAREMVEGTELGWVEVLRTTRTKMCVSHTLPGAVADYELALGIIEGKPCWIGDTAYWTNSMGETHQIIVGRLNTFNCPGWSWNPPTPKTVMVELTVEDARNLVRFDASIHLTVMGSKLDGIAAACGKALDNLK